MEDEQVMAIEDFKNRLDSVYGAMLTLYNDVGNFLHKNSELEPEVAAKLNIMNMHLKTCADNLAMYADELAELLEGSTVEEGEETAKSGKPTERIEQRMSTIAEPTTKEQGEE